MNRKVKYNLSGKRFGKLLALEQRRCAKTNRIAWLCLCDCGIKKTILSQSLRAGYTRSCGCGLAEASKKRSTKPVRKGSRFSKLKVLEFSHQDQWGNMRYKCLCDCGSIHIAKGAKLRSGKTKSCGCGQLEAVTTHGLSYTSEYYKAATYKRRLLKRKNGGNFTAEDIIELFRDQSEECLYCGKSLLEEYHVDHKTPLSRGGSNDKSNICLACPKCNLTKHTMTAEEFKEKQLCL